MRTAAEIAQHYRSPEMTPSKIGRLRLLAGHANPKIRERVAADSHTPMDVVAALARDWDPGVRATLARNPIVPAAILRDLAGDSSPTVRGFVALHDLAPADTVRRLARDEDAVVRSLVAWRTSVGTSGAWVGADSEAELVQA